MTSATAPETLSLAGKTALITAGASGMGRAAARLFAAQGAHVIIADIDTDGTNAVVDEIKGTGGSCAGFAGDLSEQAPLDELVALVKAEHTVLDVLYNHVGVAGPRDLEYDRESWMKTVALNNWVGVFLTQQMLPLFRRSSSASIIYTASTAGLTGVAPLPTYAATKGAVIQFMKSVALLLAPEGIRANAICPGATDTAQMRSDAASGVVETALEAIAQSIPLRRLGQPEDAARLALYLASEASSYVTGAVIPVDGGATA